MGNLIHEDETFAIRGAIFEVYKVMGCGFVEPVYQECLERELMIRRVPFAAQPEIALSYKGYPLAERYRPDFVCYDMIIVEIKAVRELAPEHRAQLINYLTATGLRVGLLVNFSSHPMATIERIVL